MSCIARLSSFSRFLGLTENAGHEIAGHAIDGQMQDIKMTDQIAGH